MVKFDNKVQAARRFAELLHDSQRYGDHPYSYHLYEVVDTLTLRFHVSDKDMLCAAYLHDSIEDTGVSSATIADLFGPRVAELVSAVTDEPGVNRKERKAKTYPKIKATPGATQLKLADRIANVEHTIHTCNAPLFRMYRKEHEEFTAKLYSSGEHLEMWDYLDKLMSDTAWMDEVGP